MMTKGQEIANDVSALVRARNPILWIITKEEARVERLLAEAVMRVGFVPRTWDVAQGAKELDGKPVRAFTTDPDADAVITAITLRATTATSFDRGAWIMRDLPIWLDGPINATTLRRLRNLARTLPTCERNRAQVIIIITPSDRVPPELAGHTTVIEWPLPDRGEIAAILDANVAELPEFWDKIGEDGRPVLVNGQPAPDTTRPCRALAMTDLTRDAAIEGAAGLAAEEIAATFSRSLVQNQRTIVPALVAAEKKRIIGSNTALEWYDPLPGGLDAVGGLENLKTWLRARSTAYSPQAREYGLPTPRGTFIAGITGTGKSLTAKAVATSWGIPLLKFDLGALKSKFVGESEGNLRKAFAVIKAIGRCVVWIDEIEKALAGGTDGGADGGVSRDQLGGMLTWMQERSGEAFLIATANDITSLPPEFLRKGRWDEVWWVDLPRPSERVEILAAALKANGRSISKLKTAEAIADVVAKCEGFTGSEIAAIVPEAMFAGFADGAREITTDDLITAAESVRPISRTMGEKIEKMRAWAAERGVRTATPKDEPLVKVEGSGRQIDA